MKFIKILKLIKAVFLDADSRCFTEDFPFGLCVIKAFSLICGVKTFTTEQVLKWYGNLF